MTGGGKRSVLSRALNFPRPPSTQSWASPETPLLPFFVCTAGFEARSCFRIKSILFLHTFRTNIIPLHPPPGIPCVQDQLAARALNPTGRWSHPEKHQLEAHPSLGILGQEPGNRGWKVPSARLWILREVSVCEV